MTHIKHLIITGGTGYIGRRLVHQAISAGYEVTILGRAVKETPIGANFVTWSLGDYLPLEASGGKAHSTALIHLAHDWDNLHDRHNPNINLNLTATKMLLESCRAQGVSRFVFVSSQSARPDAPNIYGRVKWETEQLIDGYDTVSARVGLVYGGRREGMYGLILKLAKFPIIPMVQPSQLVQPIHLDEVCLGLMLLAQSNMTGWKGLATPIPIAFGNVLRSFSRIVYGHHLVILPIPLNLALFGCQLTRYIPFIPTVNKERVLGLVGTKIILTKDNLLEIKLEIKPLSKSIGRSLLGRRGLFVEGRTLLIYVLGRKPSLSLLIRYTRAIQLSSHNTESYGLPSLIIAFPALMRFIEPFNTVHPLSKRLAIASALADVSPDGTQTFINSLNHSKNKPILSLGLSLIIDVCVMPFRLFFGQRHRND